MSALDRQQAGEFFFTLRHQMTSVYSWRRLEPRRGPHQVTERLRRDHIVQTKHSQLRRKKENYMTRYVLNVTFALAFLLATMPTALGQTTTDQNDDSDWHHRFQLSSTTFTDGGTLPLSMVLGSNYCTYISGGGDQSPELSWKNAPRETRSFVVTLFDVTASFTHWGMYNISRKTTELPEDAGVA